jgi:hypothetical protein
MFARNFLVVLTAVVLFLLTPIAIFAGDPTIQIEPTGTQTDTLKLTLLSGQKSGSFLLYLKTDKLDDLKGLSGFLISSEGKLVDNALEFVDPVSESSLQGTKFFTSAIPVRLKINELPGYGTFSGAIIIQPSDSKNRVIRALNVSTTAPSVKLSMGGAEVQNSISYTTSDVTFQFEISIRVTDVATIPVTASVSPLGKKNCVVSCEPVTATFSVSEKSSMDKNGNIILSHDKVEIIKLTGILPEATEYVGLLEIRYADKVDPYTLKLVRSNPVPNLSLDFPGTFRGEERFPLISQASVNVSLTVSETEGLNTQVRPPELARLWLVEGGQNITIGKPGALVTQRDATGSSWFPVTKTTSIQPKDKSIYNLQISGLSPGTYKGEIAVRGPSSTEVSKEFTIEVKEGWFLPALLILAGVVVAYIVQYWLEKGRPHSMRHLAIALLEEELGKQLKDNKIGKFLRDA